MSIARRPRPTLEDTPKGRGWRKRASVVYPGSPEHLHWLSGTGGCVRIRLVYRDRSTRVDFHALQSLWYQLTWMVIISVGWTVAGILTAVLIGFLLFPVMLILTLASFAHATYAAYKVSRDKDYRYLQVFGSAGERS